MFSNVKIIHKANYPTLDTQESDNDALRKDFFWQLFFLFLYLSQASDSIQTQVLAMPFMVAS